MPRLNLITPPWQAQISADSGELALSLIDGVFTDRGALIARPGLFLFKQVTTTDDACNGIYWWKAKSLLLVAYGTNLYASACTDAGLTFTLINSAAPLGGDTCVFAANQHWLYVASGGQIVRWNGTLTTAAEYDASAALIGLDECTHVAYIDSCIVGNKKDTQSWYYAEPTVPDTDPLVWAATGLTAEGSPDVIKAIASAWREIIVLGSDSAEIWYDAGDATVPFSRLEGAFIEQGTQSPHTLVEADNTWLWLTQNKEVVRMQGRTPTVISSAIREELEDIQIITDAVGYMLREYYVLTFPSASRTWVYDLMKQCWYRWGEWVEANYEYSIFRGKFAKWCDLFGVTFVGGENGKLYLSERTLRTDDGATIRTEFISKAVDHGTFEYKFCHELVLKVKRGGVYKADSFGAFVDLVNRTEILLPDAYASSVEFQWEPVRLLGSFAWTWDWTSLPAGLSFDASTRTLSGTPTTTIAANSVLILTNSASGLVIQFPILLTPWSSLSTGEDDRRVELFFRDDEQDWSNHIEIDAGEIGDTQSIVKLARMGRYASRRYKIVFPAAIDVAFLDMSETVEVES